MAKKPQEQQNKTDDLGGVPPELKVDADTKKKSAQPEEMNNKPLVETKKEDDDESDRFTLVVKKGRSIQHNGVLYSENQKITLDDEDAARLIELGVAMTLVEVAKKLEASNPSGTVTINGG